MTRSTYTHEVADLICEGLSIGWPLATMCMAFNGRNPTALEQFRTKCPDLAREIEALGSFPGQRTVYGWMESDEQFKAAAQIARELGEEVMMAETVAIADEQPERTAQGSIDPADVANRKLRIWARDQLAIRFNPKRWGNKVDVNHSGEIKIQRVSYADADQ